MIENKNIEKIIDIFENKYDTVPLEYKQAFYDLLRNETLSSLENKISNIIYKEKPPTGEEFLNPENGWLPEKVVNSIYPHVKEDFLKITGESKEYFQVALYGATRLGKSFLARLLIIYTIVFIHHLREPALFYNLSPLTDLAIYFVSFKFDKTRQLYLKPIYKILEGSERFKKVKFQDKVIPEQENYGCEKIVWSKAAETGEITLASGLQIQLGNDDPGNLLGADIIQCYISEISFFIEQAGASEEEIFRLYTDIYDRIDATVGHDYLTYIYLDSSANFADSLIEQHIIKNLQYDKDTFFRWRSRWDARPYKFPRWLKAKQELIDSGIKSEEEINEKLLEQGKVFQVITGNGTIPALKVTNPFQLNDIPIDLIDHVPIDVENQYKNNLIKSIKDIGGKPTSNESKFIQNIKYIENMWDDNLRNIEGGIVIDAADEPEGLIWEQIRDKFFVKYDGESFIFYRAPSEPRFIAIDTAYSIDGDVYGFTMLHLEYSTLLKSNIAVVDFSFVFLPGKEGINLSALEHFIKDLNYKGNLFIQELNSDTFQSEQAIQSIKRLGTIVKKQSVEIFLEPYQRLLTSLIQESVKVGKNIFLKNNLECLEKKKDKNNKEKIDHPKGETFNKYHGDWKLSKCGTNAKDVADTLCSANYTARNSDIIPAVIYEEENRKFTDKSDDKLFLKNKALEKIRGDQITISFN